MPTIFALETTPQLLGTDTDNPIRVVNGGPSTLYYGAENTVSALSNVGSILSGRAANFNSAVWVVSASTSRLLVEDVVPDAVEPVRTYAVEDYYESSDSSTDRDYKAIMRAHDAAIANVNQGAVVFHPSKDYVVPANKLRFDFSRCAFIGGPGTRIKTTDTIGVLIDCYSSFNIYDGTNGWAAMQGYMENVRLFGPIDTAAGGTPSGSLVGLRIRSVGTLTGTVAKTSGSTALVGTGTSFTRQLALGDLINVPGGSTEQKSVMTITDDTHLTVASAFSNTASGQTATRTAGDVAHTTFRKVDIRGFNVGMQTGENSHQVNFEDMVVRFNGTGFEVPFGGTNSGEKYNFRGGSFGGNIVHFSIGNDGTDIHCFGTSLDYTQGDFSVSGGTPGSPKRRAIHMSKGRFFMHGGHLEDDNDADHWIALGDSSSYVALNGVQVHIGNSKSAFELFFVEEDTGVAARDVKLGGLAIGSGTHFHWLNNGTYPLRLVKGTGRVSIAPDVGLEDLRNFAITKPYPIVSDALQVIPAGFETAADFARWWAIGTAAADQPIRDTGVSYASSVASARIKTATDGNNSILSAFFDVQPGTVLMMDYQTKIAATPNTLSVKVIFFEETRAGAWTVLSTPYSTTHSDGDWTYRQMPYQRAPKRATRAEIQFSGLAWASASQANVDDIRINALGHCLPSVRPSRFGASVHDSAHLWDTTTSEWIPVKVKRADLGTVASAATISPTTGAVSVTGTTNITSITALGAGAELTLIFAGVLTVTDGSNLKLAGDFTTSADDTLTLVSDGTNWIEKARSAN